MAINTRRTIDWLQVVYAALVITQMALLSLYDFDALPIAVAVTMGLATSLVGPLLSFVVSLHIFRHRHRSRALDIASIGVTYLFTCYSFAILYAVIAVQQGGAFNLPAGTPRLDIPSALYFSFVTITTTGFGDIAPLSGLARLATCCEIATGLLYQVFVFSVVAGIIGTAPADAAQTPRTS